jgi:ArsR family transcriptional regulator, arsenate/arsenite/antimonite-responsive transcriptional repressor
MSSELGKVFKAIADSSRREILELLREQEMNAGAIAKRFKMTKPAISHHLNILKDAGLAVVRREGQQIIYSLKEDSIIAVWNEFLEKLCPANFIKKLDQELTERNKKRPNQNRKGENK